jgi:hypothetical protein
LLVAGALASTLVVRTSLHCGGYPDVVTYLAVFGVWANRRRPVIASLCWLLALLEHERALALLPWVVALPLTGPTQTIRQRRSAWFAPLVALVIWVVVHDWLEGRRPAEHATASYLMTLLDDPWRHLHAYGLRPLLGWATALQWVWLVPMLWTVALVRGRRWRPLLVDVALPFSAAGVSMLLAYDWSRLAALAFPCLLAALDDWLPAASVRARRGLAALLIVQVMTPQGFTAWYLTEVWPSWLLPW